MLPITLGGECAALVAISRDAHREARDVTSVIVVFGEGLTEVAFFASDYGNINNDEHYEEDRRNPPAARGDCKSSGHDQRAEIERIARVRIGTARRKLPVFLHMAGGEAAQKKSGHKQQTALQ